MDDLIEILRLHLKRWPWLLAGMLLMLATAAANVGLLALSGWFITATGLAGLALAAGGVMTLEIYRPGAGIRFFAVGRAVSRYGERLVNHEAVLRLLADLRVWFFRSLLPLDSDRLAQLRDGELLNRLTGDVDPLDHLYLRVAGPTLVAVVALLLGIGFLALWAPGMAMVIALILGITTLLCTVMTGLAGMAPARGLAESESRMREQVVGDLHTLAELRLYGATGERRENWLGSDEAHMAARLQLARQSAISQFTMQAAGQMAVWVAAFIGAGLLAVGTINGPVLALLLLATLALSEVLAPLPGGWQSLARIRWSAARLRQFATPQSRVPEPQSPAPVPTETRIELEGVSFRHSPWQHWCLHHVDLDVSAGERIALLGPSGAGKSALLALLLRQRDPEYGRIRIGGTDLRHLDRSTIDSLTSYLPQRTALFSGTLAENLRLASPDASDETLHELLAAVKLEHLVDTLPEGLDSWIGEHGSALSGGQARRLALARTLLKAAPQVLLDEPTEGLDRSTEKHILDRVDRWLTGRGLIIVAHDRHRLPPVDRVLRLEDGRLRRI